MKPGGTEGGDKLFLGGLALMAAGLYFFLDSVRVSTGQFGSISGWIGGGRQGMQTTSMGVIFVPLLIGLAALFYDASKRWAWILSGLGLAIIIIEMVSRIQFVMNMKSTSMLIMIVLVAAGAGFAARGLVKNKEAEKLKKESQPKKLD